MSAENIAEIAKLFDQIFRYLMPRDIMGKLLRSQRSANNRRTARKHYYHHSVRNFKLDRLHSGFKRPHSEH